jgi:ATP-dependent DNA ligase
MKTLYKKDSKGKIRQWTVEVTGFVGEYGIATTDGIVGGKIKDPVVKAAIPNNLYKTSLLKADAMMQSAIDKKLRSNYFESIEEIKDEDILFMPTGCPSGMIWEEFKDKSHVVYPALASEKLDGSKMYSTWRENRVFLNTRSAIEHFNFIHIQEALSDFYDENPRYVLDGEAYNHEYAERFEELQSIFRKQNPTPEQRQLSKGVAKFYIYDVVDLDRPNMPAKDRQVLLEDIFHGYFNGIDCLVHWGSIIVDSEEEYDNFHEKAMDDGYEGSVLKISDAPYVQRKNKNVMKRKPKFDCEFMITDVIEGTGTSDGMAASVVIDLSTCANMNSTHETLLEKVWKQESGMAKGWNHKMLKEMLENKDDYIGQMGTIEYGGITAYGKLRFPKFKAVRKD